MALVVAVVRVVAARWFLATAVLRGVVAKSMRLTTGYCMEAKGGAMLSGPGGDARANALIVQPAAWPLLWQKRRNHGSWPSVPRVKGRPRAMYVG